MQMGDLARYGLETSMPTQVAQYVLEYVHVATGLPWWAAIGVAVVGFRAATLPLAAWSHKHHVNAMQHQPEMTALMSKVNAASAEKNMVASQMYLQQINNLRARHNISMAKPLVGNLIQIPFAVVMFLALKDLAQIPITHMATGGALWFANLAVPDPYYILPMASAGLTIGLMELQNRLTSASGMTPGMRTGLRVMAVFGALITSKFSAAVLLFWVYNALASIAQALLFNSAAFRRLLNIPVVKKVTMARPQKSFVDNVKELLGKKTPANYVAPRKPGYIAPGKRAQK
ncbi:hypothetical protein H4R18_003031 [Coemansia javaensis]|uniref:Membrane insertase YidC/Oxa/ALB C-terminal domain-containing protein n=1 Tax=Coemansia javaensis TaxID=2761396 RepID=A0A9W8HF31_9FUNG|nr:hypothetical protein H4R18_003031 [Coemansia javaensis]